MQYDQLGSRIHELERRLERYGGTDQGQLLVRGLCGSYFEAVEFLSNEQNSQLAASHQRRQPVPERKCFMWLGSSFTNLRPTQAAQFLRKFTAAATTGKGGSTKGPNVLKRGDWMLVGIDRCRDIGKVKSAYSDKSIHWQRYGQNGLRNAAKITGAAALADEWTYVARWDESTGRHVVSAAAQVRSCTHAVCLLTLVFPLL